MVVEEQLAAVKNAPEPPAKILLVDDKEENLLSLQVILNEPHYQLVTAHSGREALRILLKDTDFTLIIMDVVMPMLDGFQTASLIIEKEQLKDIPIIFLTAKESDFSTVFRAYNMGAVDYMSKPIIPELLKAKVNVFVELNQKKKILQQRKKELKAMNDALQKEIVERKNSGEQVRRLNDELQKRLEQLESLDAFTYSVSHDLKSPLLNVSLCIELILADYGDRFDEQGMLLVQKMQDQVKRLTQLINDLLLFSRHGGEMNRQPVNMNTIVHGVLDEIKLSHSVNGKYKIEVDELPQAQCDENLIKQVWSNLLSNAIKYSKDKDRPEIKVEAQSLDSKIIYSVADNGIGFDMKDATKLFKVFSRTESAKKFEGSGVGLAIVKRIIDSHGGKIWVESQPEKGTTFYFYV